MNEAGSDKPSLPSQQIRLMQMTKVLHKTHILCHIFPVTPIGLKVGSKTRP